MFASWWGCPHFSNPSVDVALSFLSFVSWYWLHRLVLRRSREPEVLFAISRAAYQYTKPNWYRKLCRYRNPYRCKNYAGTEIHHGTKICRYRKQYWYRKKYIYICIYEYCTEIHTSTPNYAGTENHTGTENYAGAEDFISAENHAGTLPVFHHYSVFLTGVPEATSYGQSQGKTTEVIRPEVTLCC